MTVLVLNGPNLGRLGTREPEVYGTDTYADLVALCSRVGEELGLDVRCRQTESESELVGWLHEAADRASGVVLNPAAFTHYSIAVRDAVALVDVPVVEVHLSQPAAREPFRATNVVAGVVRGSVSGFGIDSYRLALQALARLLA